MDTTRSPGQKALRGAADRPLPHNLRPRRRSKVFLSGCFLLLIASCTLILPLHVFGSSEPATGTVFAKLSWGRGEGQVGLVRATEGLTHGPEALAVAPDGRVAILDSVNSRLVLLDADGRPLNSIRVDLPQPRFLAADNDALYVLDADSDNKLAIFSWSGTLMSMLDVPATEDVVTGLFATEQGACIETGHRDSFLVGDAIPQAGVADKADATRGSVRKLPGRPADLHVANVVRAAFSPAQGLRLSVQSVDKTDLRLGKAVEQRPLLAQGRAIDHLLSVDGDGDGGLLVGARLAQPMTRGKATGILAITRLRSADPGNTGGELRIAQNQKEEVLVLSESDYAYLGDPYVVAPDGRILQPVADASGYAILVHSLEEVQP